MKGLSDRRKVFRFLCTVFLSLLLIVPEHTEAASVTIAQGGRVSRTVGYSGETITVTLTGAYTSVKKMGGPSWIKESKNGSKFTLTVEKNTGEARSGDVEFLDGSKRWTLRVSQNAYPVTVRFNSDGGSSVSSKTVLCGNTYGSLSEPSKTGYSFEGWYTASSGGSRVYSSTKMSMYYDHTLYARWSAKKMTVSFNSQGGTSVSSKTVTYGSTYGSLSSPSRTGYSFDGWYTSSGGGSKVTSSTKVTSTSNHTLYAHWSADPVTVSFDSQGGSSVSPKKVTYGGTYGSLTTPTRDGYTFDGWYTAADGGSAVSSSTKVTKTSSHTLYAHWSGAPITIKFDSNNGSGSVESKTYTVGNAFGSLPAGPKAPAGHTFDGWYTAKSGGTRIKVDSIVSTSYTTLYAQYKGKNIMVTFDSQGGSNVSQKSVTYNGTYGELTSPTRSNYIFDGWYTAAGGGSKVTASTTVTATDDHKLYAHWKSINVSVKFDVNGGSGSIDNKTYTVGGTYGSLPGGPKAPAGYTFDGWYTEKSGGTRIKVDSTVSASYTTLYAQYKYKNIKVTLNAQNGSANSQKTVTYNGTYGTLDTPKRTGYTFDGWYTAASGGSKVTSSTKVTATDDHTLYAHWKGNSYKVNFDSTGGSSVKSKTVTFGSTYGDLGQPTKSGFVFAGWFTEKTGGTEIKSSTKVSKASDHTLYAQWKRESITVKFDSNGGYGDVPSRTYTIGEEYGSLPTAPAAPTGYIFKGWYTAKKDGFQITKTNTVKAEYKTLYAQYTERAFTVSYDSRGGSAVDRKDTVIYNGHYDILPIPKRNLYTFLGWYTEAKGGTKIGNGDKVTIAADHTLYAHWKRDTVEVKFENNGGTGNVPNKTYNVGEKYGELPAGPTPPVGYTFDGWYTEKTGGMSILPTTTVSKSYTPLYAHYKAKTFTVTFNGNGGSSVGSKDVTFGTVYGPLPIPSRTGYVFKGWFTDAKGGTEVGVSTIYAINANQTLYAHWAAKTFTITFDSRGGSAVPSKKVTYDSTYGDLPTPGRDYYTFLGWFTEKSGGGNIGPKTKVTLSGDQTLYAHWKGNPINVKFDSNGGYGNVPNQTYVVEEQYGELPIGPAAPAGYIFDGWYTAKTGGTKITGNTKVSADYTTLYAQWAGLPIKVKFDSNGGYGNVPDGNYIVGEHYDSLPTGPAPIEGYKFDGWYTEKNGGDKITPQTKVKEAYKTLYAHYKPKEFTVTLKSNGGASVEPKKVTFNGPYGEFPVPDRTGYDLDGWFTEPEGGDEIDPNMIYSINADQTLYAHWTAKKFTITFDSRGGTSVGPKTVTYDSNYGDLPTPSQDYCRFQGWFTQKEGGSNISSMSKVKITEDQTLYAHWKGRLITVQFNRNGGMGNVPARTYEIGNEYGELPTIPVLPDNYLFDGWYTALTGGTKITKSSFVSADHVVLYAHYVKDPNAFFDANPRFIPASNAYTIPYNSGIENAKKVGLAEYNAIYRRRIWKYKGLFESDEDYLNFLLYRVGVLTEGITVAGMTVANEGCELFYYYLFGVGGTYHFDAFPIVDDGDVGTAAYNEVTNKLMREMEKYLGQGQSITFVDRNSSANSIAFDKWNNLNGFFALHGASTGVSGNCTYDGSKYTMDLYFYLQDYYDFYYPDDNNWQANQSFFLLEINELAFLVKFGYATPFEACGVMHTKVEWKEGQKADFAVTFGNVPANKNNYATITHIK